MRFSKLMRKLKRRISYSEYDMIIVLFVLFLIAILVLMSAALVIAFIGVEGR